MDTKYLREDEKSIEFRTGLAKEVLARMPDLEADQDIREAMAWMGLLLSRLIEERQKNERDALKFRHLLIQLKEFYTDWSEPSAFAKIKDCVDAALSEQEK